MIELILIIVAAFFTASLIYKFYFEKRYRWITGTNALDSKGRMVPTLFYTDTHKEGIQMEHFYHIDKLTESLANYHISSKNRYHRRNLLKSLFK